MYRVRTLMDKLGLAYPVVRTTKLRNKYYSVVQHPIIDFSSVTSSGDEQKKVNDDIHQKILKHMESYSLPSDLSPLEDYKIYKSIASLGHGPYGFDMEWNPYNQKTGLVVFQLASSKGVFIGTIMKNETPPWLKTICSIFANKDVKKYVFGSCDIKLIKERFDCDMVNYEDIQQSYSKRGYNRQVGLDKLSAVFLNTMVTKNKKLTMSFKKRPLTKQQINYAATDAILTYKLGMLLDCS